MTNFEPDKLYFIRFANGDNIVSEVMSSEFPNGTIELVLKQPVVLKSGYNEMGHPVSYLFPMADFTITESQVFDVNPDSIVLSTVIDNPKMIENWKEFWRRSFLVLEEGDHEEMSSFEDDAMDDFLESKFDENTDPTIH